MTAPMPLLATARSGMSTPALIGAAVFSILVLVRGIQHYRGRNLWFLSWLPWPDGFFGGAWFGAFGLMVVLTELARRVSGGLEAVLAVPTLLLFPIAVVSVFWLPSVLLPRWYLDQRGRRGARLPWARSHVQRP